MTVINLHQRTCREHKMDSLLATRFFHTYESRIESLTTYLRNPSPLPTWTNSLLVKNTKLN